MEDVRWYRARIEKHVKGDKWLVFFIDYGNYDEVVLDDLRKMPNKLLNLTPLAKKCSLAYIKNPKQDSDIAAEAAEWLKARIFNNKLESQFCYQIEDTYYVILQEAGNTDPLKTVNAEILKKGFAKISHEIALPKELNVWSEIEEKAAEKGDGVWGLGEEDDEQEDY